MINFKFKELEYNHNFKIKFKTIRNSIQNNIKYKVEKVWEKVNGNTLHGYLH